MNYHNPINLVGLAVQEAITTDDVTNYLDFDMIEVDQMIAEMHRANMCAGAFETAMALINEGTESGYRSAMVMINKLNLLPTGLTLESNGSNKVLVLESLSESFMALLRRLRDMFKKILKRLKEMFSKAKKNEQDKGDVLLQAGLKGLKEVMNKVESLKADGDARVVYELGKGLFVFNANNEKLLDGEKISEFESSKVSIVETTPDELKRVGHFASLANAELFTATHVDKVMAYTDALTKAYTDWGKLAMAIKSTEDAKNTVKATIDLFSDISPIRLGYGTTPSMFMTTLNKSMKDKPLSELPTAVIAIDPEHSTVTKNIVLSIDDLIEIAEKVGETRDGQREFSEVSTKLSEYFISEGIDNIRKLNEAIDEHAADAVGQVAALTLYTNYIRNLNHYSTMIITYLVSYSKRTSELCTITTPLKLNK